MTEVVREMIRVLAWLPGAHNAPQWVWDSQEGAHGVSSVHGVEDEVASWKPQDRVQEVAPQRFPGRLEGGAREEEVGHRFRVSPAERTGWRVGPPKAH